MPRKGDIHKPFLLSSAFQLQIETNKYDNDCLQLWAPAYSCILVVNLMNLLRRRHPKAIEFPAVRPDYMSFDTSVKRIGVPSYSRPISQAASTAYSDATKAVEEEQQLSELNSSLDLFATIFPNIQFEVFREMLNTFSGDSCIEIITEQLLKHEEKYVKGRWRTPHQNDHEESTSGHGFGPVVALESRFRRESYRKASKKALCLEFKGLNRSTIEAVLAEKNYCYTLCRPTLQDIAARSWRSNVSAFFSRWRKSGREVSKRHFMLVWPQEQSQEVVLQPKLKCTGDAELDQELYITVLAPLIENMKKQRITEDWLFALRIHQQEAESAGFAYECECCFSETTFEQMSACTRDGHIACFRCLRNAVNEALFGQSWDQNVDHERGQLCCLAPMPGKGCTGCVPESVVRRALSQERGGSEVWSKLEARFAEECLLKAQIPLARCPSCPYAEHNEIYFPPSTIQYRLNTSEPLTAFILLLLLLTLAPFLVMYSWICRFSSSLRLRSPSFLISNSLSRLTRFRHLSRRFRCRSPTCGISSCLVCSKTWHDPHICHESATVSLRKTVEAARTVALKRTCPQCGLGFVKDSGCNKLTCICGYVMCYICRQGLGRSGGNVGYEHFCQHFRLAGGKCTACEKCDLYLGEDEERAVSRAGDLAEQEWREREGMIGVEGIGGEQHRTGLSIIRMDEWTLQGAVDWCVTKLVTC